jgi:hypothetical protein
MSGEFRPTCDCADASGVKLGCTNPVAYQCQCARCVREGAEDAFYSCEEHRHDVATHHVRVYGKAAMLRRHDPYPDEPRSGAWLDRVAHKVELLRADLRSADEDCLDAARSHLAELELLVLEGRGAGAPTTAPAGKRMVLDKEGNPMDWATQVAFNLDNLPADVIRQAAGMVDEAPDSIPAPMGEPAVPGWKPTVRQFRKMAWGMAGAEYPIRICPKCGNHLRKGTLADMASGKPNLGAAALLSGRHTCDCLHAAPLAEFEARADGHVQSIIDYIFDD